MASRALHEYMSCISQSRQATMKEPGRNFVLIRENTFTDDRASTELAFLAEISFE